LEAFSEHSKRSKTGSGFKRSLENCAQTICYS
jgi:hypothetical protein